MRQYENDPNVGVPSIRGPSRTLRRPPDTYGYRGAVHATSRSASGCGTASRVQNTALICPTIAVLAPMPSAMVRTATIDRPGVALHTRTA